MPDIKEENLEESTLKHNNNLWRKLLGECSTRSKMNYVNLVMVGDSGSGKTMLVRRMLDKNNENVEGYTLDYACYDVYDHFTVEEHNNSEKKYGGDSVATLGVWSLRDPLQKDLLEFALKPHLLSQTVIIITLDFTKPWDIKSSLEKWGVIIENVVRQQRSQLQEEESGNLLEKIEQHVACYHDINTNQGKISENEGTFDIKKNKIDSHALFNNIGVPIIVVGTKVDDHQQGDELVVADYIQYYLRMFCIQYGATLVFTSAKSDSNCKSLYRYILYRAYPTLFKSTPKAEAVDRDAIFIPSGYDSEDMIQQSLMGTKPRWNTDVSFNEMVPLPKKRVESTIADETETNVEDEQEWLSKLPITTGQAIDDVPMKPTTRTLETSIDPSITRNPKDVNPKHLANFFNNLLSRGDKSKPTKAVDTEQGTAQIRKLAEKELGHLQTDTSRH